MAATSILMISEIFYQSELDNQYIKTPHQLHRRLSDVAVDRSLYSVDDFFKTPWSREHTREHSREQSTKSFHETLNYWKLICTLIKNMSWWKAWYTEYQTPNIRKFLNIINIDIAAMGQRRRGFDVGVAKIKITLILKPRCKDQTNINHLWYLRLQWFLLMSILFQRIFWVVFKIGGHKHHHFASEVLLITMLLFFIFKCQEQGSLRFGHSHNSHHALSLLGL